MSDPDPRQQHLGDIRYFYLDVRDRDSHSWKLGTKLFSEQQILYMKFPSTSYRVREIHDRVVSEVIQ